MASGAQPPLLPLLLFSNCHCAAVMLGVPAGLHLPRSCCRRGVPAAAPSDGAHPPCNHVQMCKTGAGVAPIYKQGPRDYFMNYIGPASALQTGSGKLLRPGSCPDLQADVQVRLPAWPRYAALASAAPSTRSIRVLVLPNIIPSLPLYACLPSAACPQALVRQDAVKLRTRLDASLQPIKTIIAHLNSIAATGLDPVRAYSSSAQPAGLP